MKSENMFEVIEMIILNRYKVTDMNKFKRFVFFALFLISICMFTFIFTLNAYSKDIPQYDYVTVEEGDTLWTIASSYSSGSDIRELIYQISQENKINNATIYPGEIIKIAKQK